MKKVSVLGLMVVALGIAACSSEPIASTSTPAAPSGSLNIYSARHYDTDDALYDKFTEQTGIDINLIEGKADELIQRMKSEGANSPADLLIVVDAGTLWRADTEGLFQPVTSETLEAAIPNYLRHPEGHWFGLTQRARVIVYNPETVDPSELSTYEALAEPEWEDRVCIRSSSNIYNQSLLASTIAHSGREAAESWAEGIVNNFAREPEGGDTDQIRGVAVGVCDVAIANHYYWARLAKSDDPADREVAESTAIFFPNQGDRGTHVNISGAGVAANAPNPEAAIAFLEYLSTPAAQATFALGNNEFPVVEGVEVDPIVAELGEFKTDSIGVALYGENNPEAIAVFDEVGWK
ncbi:Fe(3+) ABC transporter substrate-binding protein [Synechococcus sp. PCC 7336]|uniref:Fe(3+) ABC transporter substrate-binding protein n=1 Tax=Synechococcus sp. PCC 7336 TaxID=195250 RepID=UPI00034825A0|nr:Fe(3+) ABC transporter substrate-binding protein [Synechococcus sp. PCC 7336]